MKNLKKLCGNSFIVLFLTLSLFAVQLSAKDDKPKHELENFQVTIQAKEFKKSQFIQTEVIKGEEYIYGKPSSYDKKGEAHTGALLQPTAEYVIKSKLPGGSYNVTVFYTIDSDKAPETPKIGIAMDLQKVQELEVKKKLVNSVKTSFKVNFLKGKHHTVKICLPSEGVKVREIKVTRALLPKKSKSSENED